LAETSTTTETPALPGDALRESVVDRLRTALGDAVVDTLVKPSDDLWVRVTTESWREAGFAVRDILGCDYMAYLSAIDWMPSPFGRGEEDPTEPPPERAMEIEQGYTGGETRFQVMARVHSTREHFGITMKVDVPDDALVVDSWVSVYAGANWHERQCHELFGITFAGHPDLRNIYLPTDFEGFPLRKDFPLLARIVKPWPGIVDVEPLPGEPEEESAPEEPGTEGGSPT
jgi:NADH-quinone oxidoreductase subunit C